MKRMTSFLKRFGRGEDGFSSVEFVLVFTLFIGALGLSLEVGTITLRKAMLDRGLDLAVRDIRLSTGAIPTHAAIRDKICSEAAILMNCSENLRLEMIPTDPRNVTALAATPDCKNAVEEARPLRNYVPGVDNQLMLLRACLKYEPMIPGTGLAAAIDLDADGYAKMVSVSAFVQEPQ